jgi:V/A-type H+-transporting ATPase subunit E
MGLETVLERIRGTGKVEADAIVEEGRHERQRVLGETRTEGEALATRREAEAREQASRRRVQDLARAELDARKLGLAAQEEVLNAVRAKVRERLAANPNPQALRKLLVRHAAEWKSGRVYCNARDAPDVRASVGGSFGGTIDCLGGLVIESGDGSSRLDLTHDSALSDLWGNAIKEVADRLWPHS